MAERAEQTKTLFVHISQVSSSLFLIFLWESICTRCHVISIFLCKILIGIVYTLDFCQIQHQNVWLDAIGLLILLEIVDCGSKKRNVFASITKDSFANFSNTILGDVGEPETLKNDLNRGG